MANAESNTPPSTHIECGFCLRANSDIEDPRVLLCTHVHCLECLNAFYERKRVVRCPKTSCGVTFEVTVDSLEPYTSSTCGSMWCDLCLSKKKTKQPAVCYCSTCNRKYCTKHAESHEDGTEDHSVLDIAGYRTQPTKLEVRMCDVHRQKPYSAGCRVCRKMICVDCLEDLPSCTGDAPHELFPLDKLAALLLEEINKLKSEVLAKEGVLEQLFKTTTQTLSDYNDETREMLELIRKRRDEQLDCIQEKYTQLEKELLEQRHKSKQQITEFKEENLGEKWSDVRNERLRFNAKVDHSHQCDVVAGYQELMADLQQIIDEELPSLKLPDIMFLTDKAESRKIELEMTQGQLVIESEQSSMKSSIAITLLRQVSVREPISVCQYQGQAYVASDDCSVYRLNQTDESASTFLSLHDSVINSVVHKGRVYTLVSGAPLCVKVHDLTGSLVTKWNCHKDNHNYSNFIIVDDQLIVPNSHLNYLDFYSLTGEKVKQIQLPAVFANGTLAFCTKGDDCVVVSNVNLPQVSKVKVTNGEVIWTCKGVARPMGVTCYKQFVLVAGCPYDSDATIMVVDYETGVVLNEITDEVFENPVFTGEFWEWYDEEGYDGESYEVEECQFPLGIRICNLDICGNTLIVPIQTKNSVAYFKISA